MPIFPFPTKIYPQQKKISTRVLKNQLVIRAHYTYFIIMCFNIIGFNISYSVRNLDGISKYTKLKEYV